ncbi:hypothetical protein OG458_04490 [Streptomyces sp. NBC_01281]|uniref:YncE family protein n=1 Tax=unclassified Streptomyces TaxID=2593676 RepID=UPI0022556F0D|nr:MULTISPECIES: hypothetical protein [unclassified Streptomyces]MCX4918890.1 hypothetical protein [Streptomyces sp. NBC_00687]WSK59212.1 hypothetical protein OG458_04490 [Streptomyces sp. NBC_01281]
MIDSTGDESGSSVAMGGTPHGVAVNQAGTTAYVTDTDGGTVSVISTATGSVTATGDGAARQEPDPHIPSSHAASAARKASEGAGAPSVKQREFRSQF